MTAVVVLAGDAKHGVVVLATDGGGVVLVEGDEGAGCVSWLVRCAVGGASATAAALADSAVVVSFDDKSTVVWDKNGTDWTTSSRRTLPKRASAVCFAPGSTASFLLADKFGDVFLYNCITEQDKQLHPGQDAEDADKVEPLLGHCGMVTDIAIQHGLLATADRERKIRISRYPDAHVIEGFCFGHTEFITRVTFADQRVSPILVSGSGDGSIKTWNAATGTAADTRLLNPNKFAVGILCSAKVDEDVTLVVAGVYGVDQPLSVFRVGESGMLDDLPRVEFERDHVVTGAQFGPDTLLIVSTKVAGSQDPCLTAFGWDTVTGRMVSKQKKWTKEIVADLQTDAVEGISKVLVPGEWLSALGKGQYDEHWKGKKRPKCEREDWVEPKKGGHGKQC